jgi:ribosome-associated translation inhibitor RaiA
MQLDVTFKNLRPREEVRLRAVALYEKLERFLDAASTGTLVVNVEHGSAILELVVRANGETHTVSESHAELRAALDKTFHTMEVRLRRAKEKRLARRHDGPDVDGFTPSPNER